MPAGRLVLFSRELEKDQGSAAISDILYCQGPLSQPGQVQQQQDPTYSVLERRGVVDPLVDARTEQGSMEAFGGRYLTACLYAMGDFIKRNPGTVQRLVDGLARALHWIHDTPADQVVHALPAQYALGDPALFAEVITASKPMFSVDGRLETADVERAKRMMSAIDPKIAGATIKLDETYTNQFVEKVPGMKE